MSAFCEFVRALLEGKVIVRERPEIHTGAGSEVAALLADAFAGYRLEVAGPLIPFDEAAAVRAAGQVWWASWFLLVRTEPAEQVARSLPLPPAPSPGRSCAGQHLSADLLLRHLPQIHRRARSGRIGGEVDGDAPSPALRLDPLSTDDPLLRWLERILLRWPLSGVLADLAGPPETPLDFGGHPGLLLLYAERLACRPRPGWFPPGAGRELVDLVFAECGLTPPPRQQEQGADS